MTIFLERLVIIDRIQLTIDWCVAAEDIIFTGIFFNVKNPLTFPSRDSQTDSLLTVYLKLQIFIFSYLSLK